MATRRQILEGVLFLPAMAALAAVLWLGMAAVIKAGAWLLRGWFWLLTPALPRSMALSLAVMLAALTVYGTLYWLGRRPRRRRKTTR